MDVTATMSGSRKQPRQQRAMFTVESILQAAEHIISEQGYERATTNHIAEVAGVSIGSLYQYFSNKEAIVASLVERSVVRSAEKMREHLLACMSLSLQESVPRLVAVILSIRRENAFVFLKLPKILPNGARVSEQLTTEKFLYTTIHAYYLQHRSEITIDNLETAMFVTEHLIVGAITAFLEDDSPKLSDEELVEHLSRAVINYLTG